MQSRVVSVLRRLPESAAVAVFFLVVWMRSPQAMAVMVVPALLFLADWTLRRTLERSGQSGSL